MPEPEKETKPKGGLDKAPSEDADWLIIRGRVIRIGRLEVWTLIAVNAAGWVWLVRTLSERLGEIAQVLRVR